MSLTLRACLLVIGIQLIHIINGQEVLKRVPQGFVGMRGKKYFDSQEVEHFFKRKPQFLVGVKGKKSLPELEELDYYKRAPMGFVGMRGKKDFEDYYENYASLPKQASLIGQIDYSANNDISREPSTFPLLNRILNSYLEELRNRENGIEELSMDSNQTGADSDLSNVIEKRANFKQFYGVRGKKTPQTKRPFDVTFRGKFIGVRGKKDLKDANAKEIKFLLNSNNPWTKRKGQIQGFLGMRGKKWTDESSVETDYQN